MEDLVKSPRRFGLLSVALTLALALALAACGGDDDDDSNASDTTRWPTRQQHRARHAAARLLPQRHPRAGDRRRRGRRLREGARRERDARADDLQRRHRGASTAILAGALDASFIGPNPAINALPAVERRGDPHRLRRRVGRRVPRREARDHERRRPQGQDARDAAARQHPGRRAAHLAEGRRATRPTPPVAAT